MPYKYNAIQYLRISNLFFYLLFNLFSQVAHSQVVIANGGDAFCTNNPAKCYLYDFYEYGLHEDKVERLTSCEKYSNIQEKILPLRFIKPLSQKDKILFSRGLETKLCEINSIFPFLAEEIFNQITNGIKWFVVDPHFKDIFDQGGTVIENGTGTVYQMAVLVKEKNTVYINKNLYKQISLFNKLGLIFHESIYSLSSQKQSFHIRFLNSLIFMSTLKKGDFKPLYEAFNDAGLSISKDYFQSNKFQICPIASQIYIDKIESFFKEINTVQKKFSLKKVNFKRWAFGIEYSYNGENIKVYNKYDDIISNGDAGYNGSRYYIYKHGNLSQEQNFRLNNHIDIIKNYNHIGIHSCPPPKGLNIYRVTSTTSRKQRASLLSAWNLIYTIFEIDHN